MGRKGRGGFKAMKLGGHRLPQGQAVKGARAYGLTLGVAYDRPTKWPLRGTRGHGIAVAVGSASFRGRTQKAMLPLLACERRGGAWPHV